MKYIIISSFFYPFPPKVKVFSEMIYYIAVKNAVRTISLTKIFLKKINKR